MRKLAPLALCLCLLALASPALADSIEPLDVGFNLITDNSPEGSQVNLNMNVSQVNSNTVVLQISNLSLIESVISEVYFQDLDSLVSSYSILNDQNTGNVFFEEGASPGNLPGGQDYSFNTAFAMQADNPSPKYGVGSGESLMISLTLNQGVGVATLLESLNNQGFRVGAHVQSIAGADSESYISGTGGGGGGAAAPEPATLALMGSGLMAGWVVRRRRKKRA